MYLAIGLIAGFLAAAVLFFVYSRFSGRTTPSGYEKILVAAVDEPFTARSIELAVGMASKRGSIETLYVTEIPISRSLEVEAEEETARGLKALEEAALTGKGRGKRVLPGLEKTRMGSKAILELQRQGGFDLVIFDLQPGERLRRTNRKIAEYLQEKAACTVMILGGNNNK